MRVRLAASNFLSKAQIPVDSQWNFCLNNLAMNKPLTESEYMNFSFEHRHGGIGFAVIQDLPQPNYCRVINAVKLPNQKVSIGQQAFVACREMLTPTGPLDRDVLRALTPLREQIANGELKIVNSHFVSRVPVTK